MYRDIYAIFFFFKTELRLSGKNFFFFSFARFLSLSQTSPHLLSATLALNDL